MVHTGADDIEAFCESAAKVAGVTADQVEVTLVGPVAGTHVGPGMIGITRILSA